jgi:hypothetical protein
MDQISLVISIVSLLISVLVLIIAVWHNIKTFTPIITLLHNVSSMNGELSVVLQNKGIGPATITKVEFLLDGKSIGSNLDEIVNRLESLGMVFSFFFQKRALGSVLSAGESFTPIRLVFQDNKLPKGAIDLFDRLSTRIWYRSLYGIEYRRRMENLSGQ